MVILEPNLIARKYIKSWSAILYPNHHLSSFTCHHIIIYISYLYSSIYQYHYHHIDQVCPGPDQYNPGGLYISRSRLRLAEDRHGLIIDNNYSPEVFFFFNKLQFQNLTFLSLWFQYLLSGPLWALVVMISWQLTQKAMSDPPDCAGFWDIWSDLASRTKERTKYVNSHRKRAILGACDLSAPMKIRMKV